MTAVPDRGWKLLLRAPRTGSWPESKTLGSLRCQCSHFQLSMPVMYSSDKPFWLCHCPIPQCSEMLTVTLKYASIFAIQNYLKLLHVHFYGTGVGKRGEKEKSGKGRG